MYAYIPEKIDRIADSLMEEEYFYGDKKANCYNLLKLDYYMLDVFNQSKNLPKTYYI